MRARIRRALGTALSAALVGAGLVALDVPMAHASYPVPPTPRGLTAAIEDLQPYVGQTRCHPVAQPGAVAFRNLLMRTYTDSGSYGIVKDCGSGGQSEHKEGRAFDWKMSVHNARQRAEVRTLLSWLLATDRYGNTYAMARRFGIMYMIWDHHIFKLYDGSRGWQAYHGVSPHTDHVHFSFGWNGAERRTSYWTGTVAPLDFGPDAPPHVTPVRAVANIALRRAYGGTTVAIHSTGDAAKVVQRALRVSPVDGDFGPTSAMHIARFQVDQQLPVTQVFGAQEWARLFPYPIAPFGLVDPPTYVLGNAVVRGWAIDADTQAPVTVTATVDGATPPATVMATLPRSDVGRDFPEWGPNRGFELVLPVTDGSHTICLTALNAPGTPGTDTPLGCKVFTAQHSPVGGITSLTSALGTVSLTGWALDPDTADVLTTSLTVDGTPSPVVPTASTDATTAALYPGIGDQHGVTASLTLPEGTHTVCLLAPNAAGTPGSDATVGCSTVKVEHSPVGALTTLRRAPGGVLLEGWALDPDVAAPAGVTVTSDGRPVGAVTASLPQPQAPGYTAQGPAHGFSTTVDLPAGSHRVCATVANAVGTPGTDLALPCSTVQVSNDAAGVVTALRTVPGGSVLLTGDAYDPDSAGPATVTVLLDGVPAGTLGASRASSTAAARWPGYGAAHGFAAGLTVPRGRHTVCARAENAAGTPGSAATLLCGTVVVNDATGGVTSVARRGRTVVVRGWALDPDRSAPTQASLVVDGRVLRTVVARGFLPAMSALAPGYGSYHGFALTGTLRPGTHSLCVVSRNLSGTPGSSQYVGCRAVTVS